MLCGTQLSPVILLPRNVGPFSRVLTSRAGLRVPSVLSPDSRALSFSPKKRFRESPLPSRGGPPHLWIKMLHELLPGDVPQPGYRKTLLSHGGSGSFSQAWEFGRVRPRVIPPHVNTTPEETVRAGDRPQRAAAGSKRAAGSPRASAWAECLLSRDGRTHPRRQQLGGLGSTSPTPASWFPSGLLSVLHRHAEVKGHEHGAGRPSPTSAPAFSAAARPGHPTPDSRGHRGEADAD